MRSRHLPCGVPPAVLAVVMTPLALVATASGATGADEQLDFHRPESWSMAYVISATIPTSLGAVCEHPAGQWDAGLELGYLPPLSADQRMIGFDGSVEEDTNRTPVLARLRLGYMLPADIRLMVGWIPPVKFAGVSADLVSLALERPLVRAGRWTIAARLYGEYGQIRGDITSTAAAASQPAYSAGNPLGTVGPSRDRFEAALAGLEVQAALQWWARGPSSYLALAGNAMHMRFSVDALEVTGEDTTTLYTHGETWSGTLGTSMAWDDGLRVALELFYSPLTVERLGQSSERQGLLNGRLLVGMSF